MSHQVENPVRVPPFCDKHSRDIVVAARYKDSDPWRALMIVVSITMFQGATVTPSIQKKLGGKIEDMSMLKCLGCCLPVKFQAVRKLLKNGADLGAVKRLGEQWLAEFREKGGHHAN